MQKLAFNAKEYLVSKRTLRPSLTNERKAYSNIEANASPTIRSFRINGALSMKVISKVTGKIKDEI